MTVDLPPPTTARFGRPLELARVHWVRPELIAQVTFLTWTADGTRRHATFGASENLFHVAAAQKR